MKSCDHKKLKEKLELSNKLRKLYPHFIPTIIRRNDKENYLHDLDKQQFLIPADMSLGAFVNFLKRRLGVYSILSLWIYSNSNMLTDRSQKMSEIYDQYVEIDGFLYLTYKSEESFG